MNSESKKKLSEYQIEDIKEFFVEVFKKISSRIILLEIGNDFINIAIAKSQKNKLFIKKVFRQNLFHLKFTSFKKFDCFFINRIL